MPAGVMWSRILARVLEDWLRQDRLDGISDGYCDLLVRVQRLLRTSSKTLILLLVSVVLSAGSHFQLGLSGLGRSTMMGAEATVVLNCCWSNNLPLEWLNVKRILSVFLVFFKSLTLFKHQNP